MSVLAFINVPMARKRQPRSGKFTIWKVLIVKFSKKFEKNLSRLHLKKTSPSISSTILVVQN